MSASFEVGPAQLFRRCEFSGQAFHTTADLDDLETMPGQQRGLHALGFGTGIRHQGYNLYVMGSPGLGRHRMTMGMLAERSAREQAPGNWAYVNNFQAPHRPLALHLPAGTGARLSKDMEALVTALRVALPAAFETDDYRIRLQSLNDEFKEREEQAFAVVAEHAGQRDIMLLRTPGGYTLAPTRDGEVIGPDEFEKLPEARRSKLEAASDEVRGELRAALRQVEDWRREHARRVEELNREIAEAIVEEQMASLLRRYQELPAVCGYLDGVRGDLVEHIADFRPDDEAAGTPQGGRLTPFNRYTVNLLVGNGEKSGAPVIYEAHPTYQNLVGRIEHLAQFGTLLTDFTLIKPGALHRANGGYLVLDARKVLSHPFAWDALKAALRGREVRIQSLEQMLSMASTISLEPEPIPLDVKVVLIGDRLLYYLLNYHDPEFGLLFKVQADLSEDFDRSDENTELYARLIATLQRREKLLPMDRDAVARVIEYAARRAQDAAKLSLHIGGLLDVLHEADYWARQRNGDVIQGVDVDMAIDKRVFRASQPRERVQESILRDIRLVDTTGERVGQVNGLAVVQVGEFSFGFPSRISATARLGSGRLIDIEREVKLGGATHSKGVLILSAYLASRFAAAQPLSLHASLVFEQSYGGIDGDSASTAELCALQSALSGLPLRQDLAITGSVNQQGGVQAIGGVNEKIEGFFDICRERGLSGTQGVIIPRANLQHLMLRREVVDAAREGRFRVYAVTHVDQAMAILTGIEAGDVGADGAYPPDSVNGRIQARVRELGRLQQRYASHQGEGSERGAGEHDDAD